MRLGFIGALIAALVIVVLIVAQALGFGLFGGAEPTLDTKTRSIEVAGFYARGDYAGELLQSDTIVTNVTTVDNQTTVSQSIVFKGAVCVRVPGQGRVFLDGARVTEPDAMYRVYINGKLQFTHNMEVGSSSPLMDCFTFVEKDYVLTQQVVGSVRVELSVYVFDFDRGAGSYSVLASDQAKLT